jgi:hypothetical protein
MRWPGSPRRSISFIPGGLGIFEGAAVLVLRQLGIPLASALSAALLFSEGWPDAEG